MANRTQQLIKQLATSKKVQKACRTTGDQVMNAAKQIDPTGRYEVRDAMLSVNGLPRVVAMVWNLAPDAAKKEWGGAKQTGWRPLGRAAQKFKG